MTIGLLPLVMACKKETIATTKVSVVISEVDSKLTTYNISFTNGNGYNVISVSNANSNETYTAIMNSGDKIKGSFTFITQGKMYGQGKLTIQANGQTIKTFNGGSGTNLDVAIP